MKLASFIDQYHDALQAKYGSRLLPSHLRAIRAIRQCHTPEAGELFVHCPDCSHDAWRPRSCGHRSCPQCQNHEASVWLDRQQAKLLPVEYFLVTFLHSSQYKTGQTGLSLSQMPCANADHRIQAACMGIRIM